jgi:hypothetical protein
MSAPYLHLGLWDAASDSVEDLRARTLRAVDEADLGFVTDGAGTLTDERRLHGVERLPAEHGALVEVVMSISDLDVGPDDDEWTTAGSTKVAAAVDRIIGSIRPALAMVCVEFVPADPVGLEWDDAVLCFRQGWVDLDRCEARQRAAFERLVDDGLATRFGPGVRWPRPVDTHPDRDTDTGQHNDSDIGQHVDLVAARAFAAWTGQPMPELSPPGPSAPEAVQTPSLWFWSADVDDETLERRVGQAVRATGLRIGPAQVAPVVYLGEGDPGWRPVVVDPDDESAGAPIGTRTPALDRAVADLEALLRAVVGDVRPSWAGVQPGGGFYVPGFDPDVPLAGQVTNVWVSRAFAGDGLGDLDAALAGARRDEVAGGVLWATWPLPDDVRWVERAARLDRLTAAAEVLSRLALAARPRS